MKNAAAGKNKTLAAAFPVRGEGELSALEIKELKRTLAALIVGG